jgi:hypothetical protein
MSAFHVTEAAWMAVMQRIERLEAKSSTVQQHTGNVIGKGKYAPRSHDYVVQHDPGYVIFLEQNGHLANFGFTNPQLAEARERLRKLEG